MPRKVLTRPKDIRQTYNDTCWAAVTESFCSSARGRPRVTEAQVIDEYSQYCYSDGTMKMNGLWAILGDIRFGLKRNYVSSANFTPSFLYQKLCSGYVMIGYWEVLIGGRHVSLIYGVDGDMVYFQNPDHDFGGYKQMWIDHFSGAGIDLIVGWQRW